MKKFHLALGVVDVEASAKDYTRRLGCAPDLLIPGEYALCERRNSTSPFVERRTMKVAHSGTWGGKILHGQLSSPSAT